jgi:signal transduction histidine kinase
MEQKLLEEQINREKAVFEATLQAEEDQRSQIGRDLHDGVGQMLAYMTLYMNMIKAKGQYGNDELEELQRTTKQTLEQVRTLSRNLAPPAIRDLGLRDAVIEMINSYKILKTPVFKLSIYDQPEDEKIAIGKKIVMYRVLQELLNNTYKYAEACKVHVKIYIKQKQLHMQYSDNGKGFDKSKIKKGVGLESIRSRIKYHRGDVEIITSPGKGFSALLKIPL